MTLRERHTGLLMAVLTLVGAIAGGVTNELLDYFKTARLRTADARIKAVELGWNQSVDAFQRLFGLRAKLRADIGSYRDAEIYTRYFSAAFKRDHDPQDQVKEMYYLRTIDDYAMRVVDDRTQMQSLLGWFDYVLPEGSNPIKGEMRQLIDLDRWYPPPLPGDLTTLESWFAEQRRAANDASRAEIDRKFDALQRKLKQNQQQLLRAPTRRYIAILSEADK